MVPTSTQGTANGHGASQPSSRRSCRLFKLCRYGTPTFLRYPLLLLTGGVKVRSGESSMARIKRPGKLLLTLYYWHPTYRLLIKQEGRAAQILAKYHANNGDERDPLVVFEMAQIRHAIRLEERVNQSTTYISLFRTPGNRKRMMLIMAIAVFSQWRYGGFVTSCLTFSYGRTAEMVWSLITSTWFWRASVSPTHNRR
jgi:hypothetical protein